MKKQGTIEETTRAEWLTHSSQKKCNGVVDFPMKVGSQCKDGDPAKESRT